MHFQVIVNSFSGFGPFCFGFKSNEPCTVYDLKQRLAKATAFSVEEQKIRSLGGRILTDSDNLLQDYSVYDGPIILNLTVRLIGGRDHKESSNDDSVNQALAKKIKLSDREEIPVNRSFKEPTPPAPIQSKGKEKESRKRKLA